MNKIELSPEELLRRSAWVVSAEVMSGLIEEDRVRSLIEQLNEQRILVCGIGKKNLSTEPNQRIVTPDTTWATGIRVFLNHLNLGDPMVTMETPFFDTSRTRFNPLFGEAALGVTTMEEVEKLGRDIEFRPDDNISIGAIPAQSVEIIHVITDFSQNPATNPRAQGRIIEARLFERLERSVNEGVNPGYYSQHHLSL